MDGIEASAELLTVAEVAARLRVKSSWVYQHASDLRALRVGKYLRFRWDWVLERLEQGIGKCYVGPSTQRPISSDTKAET
jgi:excisionase family DNA binding protein